MLKHVFYVKKICVKLAIFKCKAYFWLLYEMHSIKYKAVLWPCLRRYWSYIALRRESPCGTYCIFFIYSRCHHYNYNYP